MRVQCGRRWETGSTLPPPSWIPGLVLEERHHDEDDLLNDVDEDEDHHGVNAYVFNVWNCANANYTNAGDDVIHVVLKMPILQTKAIDGNICRL